MGEASVVLRGLDDGPTVLLNAAAEPYPASMIKVPIAMALAALAARGTVRWEDTVTVEARNMTANDAPSAFVAGYSATLAQCVGAMLSRSDNVATNVLIDVIGREILTLGCRQFGLERTAVRRKLSGASPLIDDLAAHGRNAHPPLDCARLFERIAQDAAPYRIVRDALLAQCWNDKLSRGWDARDTFAHKTGDTDATSHDGGILTLAGGRRYVVVVYSTLASNADTDRRFTAFARGLRRLLVDP